MTPEKIPFAQRPVGSFPATPHQRQYARILMRDNDLDTRCFTLAHDRFFRTAAVTPPRHGSEVDAGLCALDRKQITALIQALKQSLEE